MRLLEHRRHSMREPASPHLSAAGVALAQRVAPTIGPFDRVVTSPKPRAVETAAAMGFRVDAELESLSVMPDALQEAIDSFKPRSFADYAALVERNPTMARYARSQEALWRRELKRVSNGGRLLIVSHGGVIESGAVIAAPTAAGAWGPTLGYLEGIRLYRDGDRWVRAEVLRVEP
jgi:broad specificity phosphatase PhoE